MKVVIYSYSRKLESGDWVFGEKAVLTVCGNIGKFKGLIYPI